MNITMAEIERYAHYLRSAEKAEETISKYARCMRTFAVWLGERELSKPVLLEYKSSLETYSAEGANSSIKALNSYLKYSGYESLRLAYYKIQIKSFTVASLTDAEVKLLIGTAFEHTRERAGLFILTLLVTGIRVSELSYITVEALHKSYAEVFLKGKVRYIIIHSSLCDLLIEYAERNGIESGSVFITSGGKPLDRHYMWQEMKKLARIALIDETKVYPHALRRCFARLHYSTFGELVELANILGHSSIETTRRYVNNTLEHSKQRINSMSIDRFMPDSC